MTQGIPQQSHDHRREKQVRNRKMQNELKRQGYYDKFGKNGTERGKITEERLNRTTEWGSADPTARQAVDNIIAEQKALLRAARAKVKVKNKITEA